MYRVRVRVCICMDQERTVYSIVRGARLTRICMAGLSSPPSLIY